MAVTLTATAAKHVAAHPREARQGRRACASACARPAARASRTSSSTPTTSKPEDVQFESHGVKVVVDPEEPAVSRRHRARLRARRPERRLQVQQPERQGRVRLRRIVQRLRPTDGPRRRRHGRLLRVGGRMSHDRFLPQSLRAVRPAAALPLRPGARSTRAYRELQARVHPDRFAARQRRRAAARAASRRRASTRPIARSKDPVQRAQYLLALHGVDALGETDTQLPLEFPERQLERREAADEALAARRRADARCVAARRRARRGAASCEDASRALARRPSATTTTRAHARARAHVPRPSSPTTSTRC